MKKNSDRWHYWDKLSIYQTVWDKKGLPKYVKKV